MILLLLPGLMDARGNVLNLNTETLSLKVELKRGKYKARNFFKVIKFIN